MRSLRRRSPSQALRTEAAHLPGLRKCSRAREGSAHLHHRAAAAVPVRNVACRVRGDGRRAGRRLRDLQPNATDVGRRPRPPHGGRPRAALRAVQPSVGALLGPAGALLGRSGVSSRVHGNVTWRGGRVGLSRGPAKAVTGVTSFVGSNPTLSARSPGCRPGDLRVCGQSGGAGGIRTHGPLRVDGFQDRCLRPLGHRSGSDVSQGVSLDFWSLIQASAIRQASSASRRTAGPWAPAAG